MSLLFQHNFPFGFLKNQAMYDRLFLLCFCPLPTKKKGFGKIQWDGWAPLMVPLFLNLLKFLLHKNKTNHFREQLNIWSVVGMIHFSVGSSPFFICCNFFRICASYSSCLDGKPCDSEVIRFLALECLICWKVEMNIGN